jgi:hypothetical protein
MVAAALGTAPARMCRADPARRGSIPVVDDGTTPTPGARPVPAGRLAGWLGLVGALAAIAYAAKAAGGNTPDDVLYEWVTAAGAAVQYGIVLAVALALCRGIDRSLLGLVRPPSWPAAAGWSVLGLVAIYVAAFLLDLVLEADEEQGLVPDGWDPERAAPFVANFVVVAVVAPIVEELVYRGVGIAVTAGRVGVPAAVAVTSLAFGLAHGLVVALPILTLFGVVLALVRLRTRSLYPAVALHAAFNAIALTLAVTVGTGS